MPRDLHREAAKLGLFGLGIDEEVGGSGGDLVDASVLGEEFHYAGAAAGVFASLFTHGIALPHLIAAGDPDQIDRWVRPTLAGEKIGSLAITEPDGGSDVGHLRTTAVRDGDHFVVNGAKTYITSAVRADFVTTAVRTGGPGASGVVGFPSLMSGLHDLMPGLEVYTLDHRGTGYSGFLECPEQQRPDSEYGAGISDAELEGCIAAMRALQGEGLSTLGSTSSAIDLAAYIEASRRPDTPVYLWGGSYGAYLALRFLRLFPEGVDGVIIEGIVKPDVTFINHDETSDRAGRWLLEECAADEACAARLGDDPAATLAEAMARHDVGACEHVPIDSQSFQQLLVYIMYSWVTSGVVPALIHRYHRCAPEDGEALMFLWEFLFGEEGAWVADTTDRSYSLLLQLHVIHSEMWEHPDYDLEEVPGTLEAFWGECLFCRRNIQTYVDTHDVWPRYDDSAYGDSYAESDVPMLMMHGRLDPTASAPEAEEVGAWFTGANQTFVMFPQAAHNISSGTPYRPLRPHCGMKLWLDFMADPTAALDTSCVAEVQPINFEGTEPLARALLGTGSFFELEGDGKAAPVAPDPAALEALRALRRRVQVDRLQRRLRSPALGR